MCGRTRNTTSTARTLGVGTGPFQVERLPTGWARPPQLGASPIDDLLTGVGGPYINKRDFRHSSLIISLDVDPYAVLDFFEKERDVPPPNRYLVLASHLPTPREPVESGGLGYRSSLEFPAEVRPM